MREFSRERCLEILRLSPNPTPQEVQTAFRKRVRECHPDVQQSDPAAEAELKRVLKAYRTLSSGKALSREDLLTEAWAATTRSNLHPTGADVLPRFQLDLRWILTIVCGVMIAAVAGSKLIYAVGSWSPWFETPAWMEMTDGARIAWAVLFTSQFAGAGAAAAASSDASYRVAVPRAMLGGIAFAATAWVMGLFQPLASAEYADAVLFNLVLLTALSCLGAVFGACLVVWLQFNCAAFYANGGQSLAARRVAGVVAACFSLGAFWLVAVVTCLALTGVFIGAIVLSSAIGGL
ncbi:MAG: DnaJ domain-containing protein [Armatimonadota bacterium]